MGNSDEVEATRRYTVSAFCKRGWSAHVKSTNVNAAKPQDRIADRFAYVQRYASTSVYNELHSCRVCTLVITWDEASELQGKVAETPTEDDDKSDLSEAVEPSGQQVDPPSPVQEESFVPTVPCFHAEG